MNRVMIVGSGSGCGKTTVTCGLLKALKTMDKKVMSFKCGPDYIDPMFHTKIVGTPSRNLDLFLLGENTLKYLLAEDSKGYETAVIEGAMGMYDGKGFEDDAYSANHIARLTGTPEILVVNVKGKSVSLLAEISGYMNFGENLLKGVIFNNCTAPMYPYYRKMVEENLNIKVLGYMPYMEEATLESRHLGLITADEIDNLKEKIEIMGERAAECLDIQGILEVAAQAPEISYENIEIGKAEDEKPVKIAVAKDKVFCFYYEDNFTLLKRLGAELIEFSPMTDKRLPEGISGLILGGGYPEEYPEIISENKTMMADIKNAIEKGMPTYAECGGFMYLGETITKDHKTYEMVGAIEGNSVLTDKLVRFGYKELVAEKNNLMCRKGEKIMCHEFHHSETDNYGDTFVAIKGKQALKCVVGTDNLYAGYPHLHLWGNIEFAKNFVKKCRNFSRGESL